MERSDFKRGYRKGNAKSKTEQKLLGQGWPTVAVIKEKNAGQKRVLAVEGPGTCQEFLAIT